MVAPPRKRTKTATANGASAPDTAVAPAAAPKQLQPRLFAPFRALGFVSNDVPFALQTRSSKDATTFSAQIVTCLGRSWAMWDVGTMRLLFVSPDAPAPITSLAVDGKSVFAAGGDVLIRYVRGKEVARYTHPEPSSLSQILIFGSQVLALRERGTGLLVWDIESAEFLSEVEFTPGFTAAQVIHPATYLNKVLVASAEGDLQLWNIRTRTLIHAFSSTHLRRNLPNSTTSPITTIVQSPAIDVIAIGYLDGLVSLYDVRVDEELLRVRMDGGVSIADISFRTDGQHVMATSSSAGSVALWDLNERGRLLHLMKDAHDAAVAKAEFLPNQPVLVTASGDNSMKQWLFDSPTTAPRLLKFRAGHTAPPHLIRHYGDDGKAILSAGRDRSLRYISVVRDSRSFELSQGSLAKKSALLSVPISSLRLPPVTSLAFSLSRSKDWDDVLTAHGDDAAARTWHVQDKKLGKFKVESEGGVAKAVCVSACGNFGFVGSSTSGQVTMFNMQSGIKRKTFSMGALPGPSSKKPRAITGIATDSLNRTLIASTLDGAIHFFDFHTVQLDHTVQLPSNIVSITLQRDNGLLAVICDDLVLRILDIETHRVVRELGGFRGRILDIAFSPDSRWLVAASLDSVIRTFDVPTGGLVDAFKVASIPTSISFSPTGDFVATSHVDSVGVFLWANKAQFTEVPLRTIVEDEITEVALPSMQGTEEDEALEDLPALPIAGDPTGVQTQLVEGLLTLSVMPRSRWQTLLNLETIKERNKPKEPPKAPEKAPFFLPSLRGKNERFALGEEPMQDVSNDAAAADSHRLSLGAAMIESDFTKKLAAEDLDGPCDTFFAYVQTLSPAATDLEIRSLVSLKHISLFLRALAARLRSQRDFEAVQALLGVLLKGHGDILVANAELRADLEALMEEQRKESARLMDLISYGLGVLSFVRDVPM